MNNSNSNGYESTKDTDGDAASLIEMKSTMGPILIILTQMEMGSMMAMSSLMALTLITLIPMVIV